MRAMMPAPALTLMAVPSRVLLLLAVCWLVLTGPGAAQETDAAPQTPVGSPAAPTPASPPPLSAPLGTPVEESNPLPAPTGQPPSGALKTEVEATARAYGAFQRGYYLTAMDLALSEAAKGNARAQTLVAELFAEGLGVARNMDEAAFWYEQAARSGDPSAQFKFAIMLFEGRHVPRDPKRSAELMLKAADGGNAFAQFNHAQSVVAEKPGSTGIREALPYFEKSAEQGVRDAQYALAQIYMNTDGISEDKRATARSWIERAARGGYDTAQLDLAIWLIDGIGGDKNYDDGFRWMQLAAMGGNVVAQNRLAILYINAVGTRGDPVEAGKWYILSKRAGYDDRGLDDFYQGLTSEEQKAAIDAANRFRPQ